MGKLQEILRQLRLGTYLKNSLTEFTESRFLREAETDRYRPKKIIVEYSSPNIAKPFHAGHLRSTLIGRFIAGFLRLSGHEITTINYLGDWGVQFGILARGFKEFGGDSQNLEGWKSSDLLKRTFEVYVSANEKAEKDPDFLAESKKLFFEMEQGNEEALKFWRAVREASLREFEEFNKKLNINFDFWHGEHMYYADALKILERGRRGGKIETVNDVPGVSNGERFVPLARSDGTTLYLTRDIAAVLDREIKFGPDCILYVVERGQERHFENLKLALACLGYGDLAEKVQHVPFGRIRGMSTREGSVVFVEDILNAGTAEVTELLKSDRNIKIEKSEIAKVAKQLAVSSLTSNDLKEHRQHDYKFCWKRALQLKGDSGVYLQLTHARLCTLLQTFPQLAQEAENEEISDFSSREEEALKLISAIEKFEGMIVKTYAELEGCHFLQGLYQVSRAAGSAYAALKVKGESNKLAKERLLLLIVAKELLGMGLQVLGLKPLEKF